MKETVIYTCIFCGTSKQCDSKSTLCEEFGFTDLRIISNEKCERPYRNFRTGITSYHEGITRNIVYRAEVCNECLNKLKEGWHPYDKNRITVVG